MSKMYSKMTREDKQAGMVAIMVTMILMIVISLIVVGFAQISRRNQRQALDRQLSTQAFYAAETGVNDASDLN
jgi:Tfp pilus assembly protein PilX